MLFGAEARHGPSAQLGLRHGTLRLAHDSGTVKGRCVDFEYLRARNSCTSWTHEPIGLRNCRTPLGVRGVRFSKGAHAHIGPPSMQLH